MLWHKLQGAGGLVGADATGIQYVGGYTRAIASTLSNVNVTFGGNLTGGLTSSASANDLVVVFFGVAQSDASDDETLAISGYTQAARLFSNDSQDAYLLVAYKKMGSTPDSSFTIVGGTGSGSGNAGAVAVHVFRGVDQTTPLDVTTTTATALNSARANPPAITPSTSGAWIVAGGSGGHTAGTRTFSSSDLSSFISIGNDDSDDITVGAGYYAWGTGAFDPAQFTFSASDSANFAWCAATLALRPQNPS